MKNGNSNTIAKIPGKVMVNVKVFSTNINTLGCSHTNTLYKIWRGVCVTKREPKTKNIMIQVFGLNTHLKKNMDFWEFLWIPLLLACLNISMSICDCPQGFKEIGSKCYYFSSIATTQESAQQACNSKSSKLFEPESSQVLELVKSELDTDDTWWIGLQRDNPESM